MKKQYQKPTISEVELDNVILLMGTSGCDHPGNGHHNGHGHGNGNHNAHNNPKNPWYGCDSFVEDPFGGNSPFD